MAKVSILLITVALIVGVVVCVPAYNLTIDSTAGGSITTPGEGAFTYNAGTGVNLTAESEEGYRFVEWTGDVGSIDNVNAAITAITMHDNYSITANFGVNSTPMVAAGWGHTVGLKDDGTVFAVGDNRYGQCDIGGWTDITQIAAGNHHTVGLQADGTVVAVGWNHQGQCRVGGWTDIVWVAAGTNHTVGVKSEGTVVAGGYSAYIGRAY